jgi:putative nucleotidyltransferase with HDIG domain
MRLTTDAPRPLDPIAASGDAATGYVAESEIIEIGGDRRAVDKAARSFAAKIAKKDGPRQLPLVTQKLMTSLSATFDLDDVVRLVESDPLLATRLLREINSPLYARRGPCKSVRQAVTFLGHAGMRSFVMTTAVFSMFDDLSSAAAAAVMEHAKTVGALARALAPRVGLSPDDMFTCGLLHDVGKLIMLMGDDLDYPDVLAANDAQDRAHLVELERYGYDHAQLGAHVLRVWKLPSPIPRIVSWHHQPERAYDSGQPVAAMVAMLRLADHLAYALSSRGAREAVLEGAAASDGARHLGLTRRDLETCWAALTKAFDDVRGIVSEDAQPARPVTPPALPSAAKDADSPAISEMAEPTAMHGVHSARPVPTSSLVRIAVIALVLLCSSLPSRALIAEIGAPLMLLEVVWAVVAALRRPARSG